MESNSPMRGKQRQRRQPREHGSDDATGKAGQMDSSATKATISSMSSKLGTSAVNAKSERDLRPIIVHLEGMLNAFTELKHQLALSSSTHVQLPAPVNALHNTFVSYSLSRLGQFPNTLLRPIASNATWIDVPTGEVVNMADMVSRGNPQLWLQAFPNYQEAITNIIGNENYVVFECRGSGTHTGDLRFDSQVIKATGKKFDIQTANVIKTTSGQLVSFEQYYDMAGIMRTLGLLPDVAMGHDEPAHGKKGERPLHPPMLHPTGFVKDDVAPMSIGGAPIMIGLPATATEPVTTIGSSNSKQAQQNIANCTEIHKAFMEHNSARFNDLIDPKAIWVDIPTGQVLNGAVAAANHDQGNWQTAFPDSTAEVTNMIGNEQWVVVQHRGVGTHLGPLQLGGQVFQPTGRKMDMHVLDIVQYREGKAILIRNYYDMEMMMLQLGIAPKMQ